VEENCTRQGGTENHSIAFISFHGRAELGHGDMKMTYRSITPKKKTMSFSAMTGSDSSSRITIRPDPAVFWVR
jgi:hypothetical protein